jgi:hypothetical protein
MPAAEGQRAIDSTGRQAVSIGKHFNKHNLNIKLRIGRLV